MKLSEMFAALARGAEDLEKRAAQWEAELADKSDKLRDDAKLWMASAQKRDDELRATTDAWLKDASAQVKAQWLKTQAEWDAELSQFKAKAEDMRRKAATLQAQETADWYEAYAAHMVSFAQRMQIEASNAVAGAAQARADAQARDS